MPNLEERVTVLEQQVQMLEPDRLRSDINEAQDFIAELRAQDAGEISLRTEYTIANTKARLPTAGVFNGAEAWCSDGRKVGEGASSGTGVPVYFDESGGVWMSYRTDAEVTV
jgi:hypothetical protein